MSEMQHEFIKPRSPNAAVLTCWEDSPTPETKPAIIQQIPFTDFPLPEIKLYVQEKILLLPQRKLSLKTCPVLLLWKTGQIFALITQPLLEANQMTASQKIPESTLQEKHKELAELQAEVNIIFAETITNQVKTADFATEIWVNAMLEQKPLFSNCLSHDSPQHNFYGRGIAAISAISSSENS